jgi:bacterioferritin
MKGHQEIISRLNRLLAGELTAIDQYFIHSHMCREWGFEKLYEQIHHEMQEEQQHASRLISRILFLEGTPDLATRTPLNIGQTVPEQFQKDLDLEYSVIKELKEVMYLAEQLKDFPTRDLLLDLLRDTEEDHAHWLEKQLGLIERVGLQNYLESQVEA